MDKIIEMIFGFLSEHVSGTVAVLIIIGLAIILPNAQNLMILYSWILSPFAKVATWAKKAQMSNKVRGTIVKSAMKQLKNNGDIMPTDLKVEWVNKEDEETFVNRNQIIVRIKQSSNPNENITTAVCEYVNEGLLHNVKRYLDQNVVSASKTYMIRKIMTNAGNSPLTYLDEHYILPKLNENPMLNDLYNELVKIDNNGMFVGILLNELYKAGMSITDGVQDPCLVAESKEFIHYLYNIALHISNDVEKLRFNREYFKVDIFLTASNRTLKKNGIQPIIQAISKSLEQGIETVYVFGLGRKQDIARNVAHELNNDIRINEIKKYSYHHKSDNRETVEGVFYECSIYREYLDKSIA